jgi:hypothetical protein
MTTLLFTTPNQGTFFFVEHYYKITQLGEHLGTRNEGEMSGKGGPELKKFMDKKVQRKALQL